LVRGRHLEISERQVEVSVLAIKMRDMVADLEDRELELGKHQEEVLSLTEQLRAVIDVSRAVSLRAKPKWRALAYAATNGRTNRWVTDVDRAVSGDLRRKGYRLRAR